MKRTITLKWGRGAMWDAMTKETKIEVEVEHVEAVTQALDHVMAERENTDNPLGERWYLASIEPDNKPNIYVGQQWKGIHGRASGRTAIITACTDAEVSYTWNAVDPVYTCSIEFFLEHWEL